MAYLGNRPAESFASFEKQVFTIVNSQTAYTLSHSVTNENDIRLVVNSVVQEPGSGKAYTASGTTLTLSAALVNGTDTMYCVFLGRALQTVNAPNASVGSDQTAPTIITGQTAETSIATDDTILIHDTSASALRKMTRANFVSGVGGTNTPSFLARSGATQNPSDSTRTTVAFGTEVYDTDSCYNNSTYTFTPNVAGKYLLFFNVRVDTDSGTHSLIEIEIRIRKNGGDGANYYLSSYNSSYLTANNATASAIVEANGSSDAFLVDAYLNNDAGTNRIYLGQHQTYFGGYRIIT